MHKWLFWILSAFVWVVVLWRKWSFLESTHHFPLDYFWFKKSSAHISPPNPLSVMVRSYLLHRHFTGHENTNKNWISVFWSQIISWLMSWSRDSDRSTEDPFLVSNKLLVLRGSCIPEKPKTWIHFTMKVFKNTPPIIQGLFQIFHQHESIPMMNGEMQRQIEGFSGSEFELFTLDHFFGTRTPLLDDGGWIYVSVG